MQVHFQGALPAVAEQAAGAALFDIDVAGVVPLPDKGQDAGQGEVLFFFSNQYFGAQLWVDRGANL